MFYPPSEGLATLAANEGCGNKVWIMVALEVHIQKLLLTESLLALATSEWLLPRVCTLVHNHVALLREKHTSVIQPAVCR